MERPKITDPDIVEDGINDVIAQMAMTTELLVPEVELYDWLREAILDEGLTDAYVLAKGLDDACLIKSANFATVTAINLYHTFMRCSYESALVKWAHETGEQDRWEALDMDKTVFIKSAAERGEIVKFLPDTYQVVIKIEGMPVPVTADIEDTEQP